LKGSTYTIVSIVPALAQNAGMGKSGGARVVYISRNERFPVFLIAVFPKNEKENLSMAERNALRTQANSIFEGIYEPRGR
jgi:hypothetical protein